MKNKNKFTLITSTIVNSTMLTLLIFSTGITTYANAESEIAGKTLLAKGNVNAIDSTTKISRALKRRSKIMSAEHIKTGEKSKAQFSMSDGGLITLKENTEINISNYIFDKETQKGSATLEVISGGLRSISGLIKKTGGDYQVKTPVGSIGIRGTHFVVDVVGDNVYFGVYSGNIDIVLNNNKTLSLGVTEGFAFASVNESSEVTSYTQAPEVLSIGYTTSEPEDSPSSTTSSDSDSETQETQTTASSNGDSGVATTTSESETLLSSPTTSPVNNSNTLTATSEVSNSTSSSIPNIDITDSSFSSDVFTELVLEESNTSTIADLISQRTGTFNYQELVESEISSSTNITSDLSLNLAVDFDNGTVPGGSLSFTDEQGEWFAAYSGLINIDQLELGVNFASHANQKAEGDISAAFSNGLTEITGDFNLHEIEDPAVKATGSFKIK